ncbi:MAG: hypothetical protein RL681_190 [Candidatus Parcubacteria bacterium]
MFIAFGSAMNPKVAQVSFMRSDAAAGDNAAYVSQTVPTSLVVGQTATVSITMRNTGQASWTAAGLYRLGSQNPQDNLTWGVGRLFLPANVTVNPNGTWTFTFNIRAPATPNTYNFQWRMLQESVAWFGDYTPNVAITVTSGDNAQFVSQAVPTTMVTGQSYTVSVTMKNIGTSTWTAAQKYRLGSQNPQDNTTWGNTINVPPVVSRIPISGDIAPQATSTFSFTVTAPTAPGQYNFQWRMVRESVAWFGEFSPNIVINVQQAKNDALFISQDVPTSIAAGQTAAVTIVMKNTGQTTWTAAGSYRLGSQNPQDNTTWGTRGRMDLLPGDSVPPGGTKAFLFPIKAPSTPGTYNLQWKMLREQVEWFGGATQNIPITVTAAPVIPLYDTPQKTVGYYLYGDGSDLDNVAGYTNWNLIVGYPKLPITVAQTAAEKAKRYGMKITLTCAWGDLKGDPVAFDSAWAACRPIADEFQKRGVLHSYYVADEPMGNGISFAELARRIAIVKKAGFPTLVVEQGGAIDKFHPPADYYGVDWYVINTGWVRDALRAHKEFNFYVAYAFRATDPKNPEYGTTMPDQWDQAAIAREANIGLMWWTWLPSFENGAYAGIGSDPAVQYIHRQISAGIITTKPTAALNPIPATLYSGQSLGTISGTASDIVSIQKMKVVIRYKPNADDTCNAETQDWNGTAWVPGCKVENQITPTFTPGISVVWSTSSTPPAAQMKPGLYHVNVAAYRTTDPYVAGNPFVFSGWKVTNVTVETSTVRY